MSRREICWTDQMHSDELEENLAEYHRLNAELERLRKVFEADGEAFYRLLMERNRVSGLVAYGKICRARVLSA